MKCVSYLSDFLTVFNERKNVTNKTRSPRTESDRGAVSPDTGAVTRLPVQYSTVQYSTVSPDTGAVTRLPVQP